MTGCSERFTEPRDFHRSERFCDKWDNDKALKFVVDCAKAANPLSDEEGEDLVAQCERTATNFTCIKHGMSFKIGTGDWTTIHHCRDAIEENRALCIKHGYKYSE